MCCDRINHLINEKLLRWQIDFIDRHPDAAAAAVM